MDIGSENMILNDFDKTKKAVLNPSDVVGKIDNFPKIGITCFSKELLDRCVDKLGGEIIASFNNIDMQVNVYKINYQGVDIALFLSRVGSPACVMNYEEILAMGLEKLVMFGTCGVLDKDIRDLTIIVPTSSIRDEGTSYHYMEASDEIEVNSKYVDEFRKIVHQSQFDYAEGKNWTTDALYRETPKMVQKRKQEGCISVDMECAAMHAVSKFRHKELFQFFYAADNLDSDEWDKRSFDCEDKISIKEQIIYLALDMALKMNK